MTSVSTLNTAQFEAQIDRLCRRGLEGRTLLRELAGHVRAVVPCEGLMFLRTDPTTVLPTDGVVDALPPALCKHFWDNELLESDYNKFVDLARRESSAATLSEATGADLSRSHRDSQLYRPLRFVAEGLRAAFAVDPPSRSPDIGPALVLLNDDGDIQAITAHGKHWLAELVRGSATGMSPVPEPVYLVAGRARAAEAGIGGQPAWAQIRTVAGVWLH